MKTTPDANDVVRSGGQLLPIGDEVIPVEEPPQEMESDPAWAEEIERARNDLQIALGSASSIRNRPCDFTSYADLMKKNIPPVSWLVQGLITNGSVAVISGEPKTAKTWLGVEIGASVALGDQVLGEFQTNGPSAVALFLTEDHEANVRARLRGTLVGHGEIGQESDPPIFIKAKGTLRLDEIGTLAWLVASVRRLPQPIRLLVIDPLRNVLGSLKENENDAMAIANANLRALRDVLDCTVLYVHHSAKATEQSGGRGGGQRMRGASALHGGYDAGLHLSQASAIVDEAERKTTRKMTIEAEVKAGRGAGIFGATLTIHDDENRNCVRADWEHSKETAATKALEGADERDEAAILAVFDRKDALAETSKGDLKKLAGGSSQRMGKAVDRLIAKSMLRARIGDHRAILVSRPVPHQLFPPKGGEQQNGSVNGYENSLEQVGTAEQVQAEMFKEPLEAAEDGAVER